MADKSRVTTESPADIIEKWKDLLDGTHAKIVSLDIASIASGVADSGNGIKIMGRYNLTKPTFADGQRGDVQLDTRGSLYSILKDQDATTVARVLTPADGLGNVAALNTISLSALWNGTTWDRSRSASAASLSALSGIGATIVSLPGQWSVVHAPAANTKATISKAAGAAGVRHVCTAFMATLVSTAVAPAAISIDVAIRDGATGAGTIFWQGQMSLTAVAGNQSNPLMLSGLNLVGTAATAMTIEFSAAAGANTVEAVSMSGYDVS